MSLAVSTTGIKLQRGAGTPAAAAITGVSAANPAVVTTGAAHGLASGDLVFLDGITGAVPDVNGLWVVTVLSGTTFSIPVTTTSPGTGGTFQEETFVDVAELMSTTPPQFSRNKIETTNHNDGTESYVLGILRLGDPAFRVNYVGTIAIQQEIVRDILEDRRNNWRWRFPPASGLVIQAAARVMRFAFADAPTDAAQQAECALALATAPEMAIITPP